MTTKSYSRFEGITADTNLYPKEHPETQRRAALTIAHHIDNPDTRRMLLDMLGLAQ